MRRSILIENDPLQIGSRVRVSRFAHRDFTLEIRPISGGFDACLSRGRFCACSRNFAGLVNQCTRRRVQQRYKICFFLAQSFMMSFTNQSTTLFGLFLSDARYACYIAFLFIHLEKKKF